MITSEFCGIGELEATLCKMLSSEVQKDFFGKESPQKHLHALLSSLKENLQVVVEYPYVDKVFRDSYYSYYASKSITYPRDAIRVSLFNEGMNKALFYSKEGRSWLRDNFLGFFVIRPTPVAGIVGRSCISPAACTTEDIRACTTSMQVSVQGLKLSCVGFPHSSQDGEAISCAETALWALVEYFSSRYPEYRPLLPSQINSALAGMSVERQLPSRGLEIARLSYGLKAAGIAPRIYGVDDFERPVFLDLIDMYIESGIPIMASMGNSGLDDGPDERVDHVFLAVGKVECRSAGQTSPLGERKGHKLFDYPNARHLVVIDDNFPPYTLLDVEDQDQHYKGDPSWAGASIDAFIVPLYPKIYMEAFEARKYVIAQLEDSILFNDLDTSISARVYLASSRSYKNYVLTEESMGLDFRVAIIDTAMPKFIWVAELYKCDSEGVVPPQPNAHGLLIVDATEPNIESAHCLILGFWQGHLLARRQGGRVGEIDVTSRPFQGFNNLTSDFKPTSYGKAYR